MQIQDLYELRNHTGNKPIPCFFCGQLITDLYGYGTSDCLEIHSLDGNHDNLARENKVPTHRKCHLKYHNQGKKRKQHKKMLRKNVNPRRSEASKRVWDNMTPEERAKRIHKMTHTRYKVLSDVM